MKALYVNGYINGKPSSKLLIDGGAAVNVMSMTTFRKICKLPKELIKTNMTLADYGGCSSDVSGVTTIEITVGSKTLPTTFFFIDGKRSYSTLLGRDWIHANCRVPSTMHHCVIQWVGDVVEIVQVDKSFHVATINFVPMGLDGLSCMFRTYWDGEMLEIANEGA